MPNQPQYEAVQEGGMSTIIKVAAVLAALTFSACSTTLVPIKYVPSRVITSGYSISTVATVHSSDDRGAGSNWLGAIRGGFGNPLKILRTEVPISDVVTAAFLDAMRARSMLGVPDSASKALEISITKFDCSQLARLEAHAHLKITIVSLPQRVPVFSKSYLTDNAEFSWAGGIFADVNVLADFAQATLNETIDKALSDPFFLDALSAAASPN